MSRHIVNRFDFVTIAGGVLRMIHNPELLQRYKKFIAVEYFFYNDTSKHSKALRTLLKQLLELDDENKGRGISLESLDSHIALMPDGDNKEAVQALIAQLRVDDAIKTKAADEGCFRNFTQYLKTIRIAKHSVPLLQEYQAGNADVAAEHMMKAVAEIHEIKDPSVYSFDVSKNYEDIMTGQDVGYVQELLYSGFAPMDSALGGFEAQTLSVFISMPNGGKSTMCHHLIKQCFLAQKRVHVTCVEDRPKSFFCKLTACWTGIPVYRLRREYRNLTSSERASVEEFKKLAERFLKVEFVYGQSLDAIHKAKLDYDVECKSKGISPPVVDIIDYTMHIAGRSTGDKMYEKLRAAYGDRKDFCLANNKIGFDFAQVNREGTRRANGEDVLTMADLAGSFDIAQVCDNIISINRNFQDRTDYKATLHVCKARDGEAGGSFKVGTMYHIAQYDTKDVVWINKPADHVYNFDNTMSAAT